MILHVYIFIIALQTPLNLHTGRQALLTEEVDCVGMCLWETERHMDRWMDGRTGGQTDGWMDGWMDGWIHGWV